MLSMPTWYTTDTKQFKQSLNSKTVTLNGKKAAAICDRLFYYYRPQIRAIIDLDCINYIPDVY